jgi:hypothetical protein
MTAKPSAGGPVLRRPVRLVLDADVLRQVEADAARAGMTTERYAEKLLAERLPALLAATAAEYVAESIRRANEAEQQLPTGAPQT